MTPRLVLVVLLAFCGDGIAGMAVGPLQQWVEVKPGKEGLFSMTVTNTDRGPQTKPLTVLAEPVDFTVSAEGRLSFGGEEHGRSAVAWIRLDADRFTLQPGESRELKARVQAPVHADGDYWAAIMFTLGSPEDRESQIQVKFRTAAGVFVRVARRNYMERTSVIDTRVSLPEFDTDPGPAEELAPGQDSQTVPEAYAFKVHAELQNDGLTAVNPNGKAYLYGEGSRRIGSIPLYTARRRVFPGHTRVFTGVMPQPLPTGQYRARLFFTCDSKYARTTFKDVEFSVGQELASLWAHHFTGDEAQILALEPAELDLTAVPGRFTTMQFLVVNTSPGTVSVRCSLESDPIHKGWIELRSPEFALAPKGQRNVVCAIRIPRAAPPEDYTATVQMEAERPGLSASGEGNVERLKVPIHVSVTKGITPDK